MADRDIQEELLELIGDVYESALNPANWPDTLNKIANSFQANGVGFHERDYRASRWGAFVQVGMSDRQVIDYADYYVSVDPRYLPVRDLPSGSIVTDPMHISEAEMDRDEFYQDFLAPNDMRYYAAAVLENGHDLIAGVTIQRSRRAGPFSDLDVKKFSLLVPHMRRALRVQRQVGASLAQQSSAREIWDRLPGGVVLIDGHLKPAFMNTAASLLIKTGDGLRSEGDGLAACRADLTVLLRRAISDAIDLANGKINVPPPPVKIDRPSGKEPLVVWAVPGSSTTEWPGTLYGNACVLLFVSIPELRPRVTLSATFAQFYGLTRTEARVLEAMLNGATPENIQVMFKVSMPTVRKHLQTIFAKTEVNRQVDLIRLVLLSPLQVGGS